VSSTEVWTSNDTFAEFASSRQNRPKPVGYRSWIAIGSLGVPAASAAAISRMSCVIFIEQYFGPHMLQKWALLKVSCGSVWSWAVRTVAWNAVRGCGCRSRAEKFARLLDAAAAADMLTWENSGFSVDASVRITLNGIQLRVYC
jgi:hypothetical protein